MGLDARSSQGDVWPTQTGCGGLAWTGKTSWKSDAQDSADQTWTSQPLA